MYRCPTCGEPGISAGAKLRSGTLVPATCARCGAKSYTNPRVRGLFGAVMFFVLLACIFLAFDRRSWIPIVLFMLAWIAGEALMLRYARLVPGKSK